VTFARRSRRCSPSSRWAHAVRGALQRWRAAAEAWSERGIDQARFFVSPNPGEDLRPLARIVSGGELSRVMLALKTLAAGDAPGKTLIFDEVDAGIGGRVADVVGARLQALGERFQVLVHHAPAANRGARTTQF
jgi:DNA repair protein RecN (Recombination protein N)